MDDCFDGIRVATAELKNPMTGQTWRTALRQHLNARDPNIDALC